MNDQPDNLPILTTHKADRVRNLAKMAAARKIEALRLYEPLPTQAYFHESLAPQRIVRGGNRAGKTLCAAVEVARAAMHCDPHEKYPHRPLLIYCIGFDQDHIGRVFHRVLFRAGLFKIIRDEATGEWRAFRPWVDAAREKEAKLAPPLIPARAIEDIGWTNKKERILSVVRLKNGTEIRFFSSKADPAQGDPVDLVWPDEDLFDDTWIPEMQARLSDRKGRLIWSAFPHSKNDALVTLSARAEEEAQLGRVPPDVHEIVLTYSQNPFIDEEQKRLRRADFAAMSEEELAARDRGEFLTDSVLMYPHFDIRIHGAPADAIDEEFDTPLDKCLRGIRKGEHLPADWCRFMSIDPGHSVCCVLFFAVPNPRFGDHVLLYDELYLRQCDPDKLGKALSEKCSGQSFYAFVIDEHGSRITEAGSGQTIKQQYSAAFRKHRIESQVTNHGFIPGSDDREGRSMKARQWMTVRDDGTIKFRILKDRCPNFIREVPRYRKDIKDKVVLDVASARCARECHAMAAFEYMVAYGPTYHTPKKTKSQYSWGYQAFLDDEKRIREQSGGRDGIWLGAGKGTRT